MPMIDNGGERCYGYGNGFQFTHASVFVVDLYLTKRIALDFVKCMMMAAS